MPGKVKVRVVAGRGLPIMDKSNDTTDAYVEVKLGQVTYKTDVCRKSLNPQWNSEWFKFEMDDLELQDEPLHIRLMDYDTYSANDAIGKVYLDLNPLLINSTKTKDNWGKTISGWLPVYDTMHGLRGEVNLIVKVELFSDLNKYRQSSCGVRFFFSPQVPEGFVAHSINGFVEELVINDDPEYQWIDKIRTPRASNEARQTLFQKLSGEVQRKVGLKTLELGGNAVVGYKQCIDIEGESGLVIRGIGTAMYLTKLSENQLSPVPLIEGASKESQCLALCQQHSLPRKRKQIPIPSPPNIQRRYRHLLPSMSMSRNDPVCDPLPVPTVNKSAMLFRGDLNRGALSSSFSNLFVRNRASKSPSPNPSQQEPDRGRSVSPPKLTKAMTSVSLRVPTTTSSGSGTQRVTRIFSDEKKKQNFATDDTQMKQNLVIAAKPSQSQPNLKKNFQSSPPPPPPPNAQKSLPFKQFGDKDKKDNATSALLLTSTTNLKDNDSRDCNTNTHKKATSLEQQNRFLAEMEPDLVLDLELVASGDTLSEISEERESQESFRGGGIDRLAPIIVRPTPSPRPRPQSLSEKESDDCSISEDSPPTSPTSTASSKTNKFTLLNLRKKHRWMTRRERLSTNCLVKRASSSVSSKSSGPIVHSPPRPLPPLGAGKFPLAKASSSNSSSSTTKIRVELGKIFKRISFSGDGDSDTNNSNSVKANRKLSPTKGLYRTPRRLFFRRRRTRSKSIKHETRAILVRSNSECESQSFSMRHTSSETSLPSIGSEPAVVFNFPGDEEDDDDDLNSVVGDQENPSSSMVELQTNLLTEKQKTTVTAKKSPVKSLKIVEKSAPTCPKTPHATAIPVEHAKLRELIGDLGYDTGKPLQLYISSMDALLVYDPAYPAPSSSSVGGAVNSSSCVCLNVDNSSSPLAHGGSSSVAAFSSITDDDANNTALHGRLDFDSTSDPSKTRAKVDTLLKLKRADSSVLNLGERSSSSKNKPETFEKSKRHRTETLVECNSSTSSSGSMTTSSRRSTSTTSSTTSGGCTTSATSSSCTKAFKNFEMRMPKFRQSDDEQVEEELEENFEKLEKFVRNAQRQKKGVDSSSSVITIGSACRSPIPEEYVEPTAAASCAIPNNTNSSHNPASSPPKRLGSPQKPIPSSTHSTSGGNGFYGDHHESKSSGQMYNGNSGSGSPEKGGGAAAASTPNTKQSNYGQMHRRSSESDLSTTPNTKGGGGPTFKTQFQRPFVINVDPIRGQEFPFITLSSQFPENFIRYLGGTVTARSVKLLKSIGNFEEPSPETRDGWWNEIRIEMRSHCRAFGCNVLLDYEEKTTMWDEVAILSASGTAAIISTSGNCGDVNMSELGDVNNKDGHKRTDSFTGVVQLNMGARSSPKISRGRYDDSDELEYPCRMLHIPQPSLSLPTIIRKSRCAYCRKGKVPDVLVATIDLPPGLHTTGRSCLIQTQVFRSKKESKGEVGAKEMSDSIPFLEYELHRRLINKLKVQGLNAIFGYKVQITQGDKVVVGVATGTAVFLTALPVPSIPTICAGNLKTDAQKVLQFQKVIQETFERNREIFGVNNIVLPNWGDINGSTSDGESDDELDNSHEAKDTFVLEVDDAEDIDIITMLIDQAIPVGYNMSNIETIVGFDGRKVLSQQMFNQVWRCKIATISQRQLTAYFERLIRLVSFKLRRLQPCVFTRMHFTIDLPESDEMQLTVIGMALGLDAKMHQVSLPSTSGKIGELGKQDDDPDIIFQFDEDKTKLGISCESSAENLASSNQTHHSTPPLSAGLPQKVPHPLSSPTGASGLSGGLQQTKISSGTSPVTASVNIALPLNVSHGHGNSSNVNLPLGETGRNRSHSVFCARHPNSNSKSTRFISFIKPMPLPVSKMRHWVEITPQKSINGAKIERYLGNLNFYFIRETTSLRESGGVNTFVHALFTDFMAIVRAHTSALGGNAIVSYFMTRCDLSDLSKCVINVGGDAVFVSYPVHHPEDGIAIG
ncbi:uncharacterized protein LOC110844368 isoform X1 [Folsomia candida]|uniref:uncharacterized protein LOC110844368 isoform X1 n=1 Tax=Folsomia candida TaxID=158441 RepID=UPI001604BB07|nr:uncharacterized protein LOC110844368 isoform X1 [Folsomia candida]